jgi:hypothetical protein
MAIASTFLRYDEACFWPVVLPVLGRTLCNLCRSFRPRKSATTS